MGRETHDISRFHVQPSLDRALAALAAAQHGVVSLDQLCALGISDRAVHSRADCGRLHRIHHSEEIAEQSRNFGQTFPWWDRLFGTYLAMPAAGEEGLVTGVKGLQNGGSLGLGFMLAEPFRSRSQSQTEPVA